MKKGKLLVRVFFVKGERRKNKDLGYKYIQGTGFYFDPTRFAKPNFNFAIPARFSLRFCVQELDPDCKTHKIEPEQERSTPARLWHVGSAILRPDTRF